MMNGEEIVRKYSDMIYAIAMGYVRNTADAEDVYSDVFYRYFRRERVFESEEHRKYWLLRVTVNCAKDLLIKRKPAEELLEEIYAPDSSHDSLVSREEIMDVRNALIKLPELYREVIELYYIQDLSVKEISMALSRPENTVKSQLKRGRESLKDLLM